MAYYQAAAIVSAVQAVGFFLAAVIVRLARADDAIIFLLFFSWVACLLLSISCLAILKGKLTGASP